jgi:hypothetical protein
MGKAAHVRFGMTRRACALSVGVGSKLLAGTTFAFLSEVPLAGERPGWTL